MADERQATEGFGRILSGIGTAWAVLFFAARFIPAGGTPLGDLLDFFGSSLFIPIALIFAGRVVTRRGQRGDVESSPPVSQPTPTRPSRPPLQSRPQPTPAVKKPPPSQPKVEREPVSQPREEDLAAATGFRFDDEPTNVQGTVERTPSHKPLSSAERIAEARKRLGR